MANHKQYKRVKRERDEARAECERLRVAIIGACGTIGRAVEMGVPQAAEMLTMLRGVLAPAIARGPSDTLDAAAKRSGYASFKDAFEKGGK